MRKATIWVFDQVRHKPACTVTENSHKLEISSLERSVIVLSMEQNKGTDQLRSYCTADLRLCFAYADCWFSDAVAHIITL